MSTNNQVLKLITFLQLCAALGLILADLETECNRIMEEQLPAIIDNLVNGQLEPNAVCEAIGACP